MAGKVGMFPDGHWIIPQLKRITEFQWDVVELPKGRRKAGMNVASGYAIPSQARHPQAAWELVRFLAGPEAQKIIVGAEFSTPALKSIAHSDIFLSPPPANAKAFIESIEYGHLPPVTPVYERMMEIINRNLELLWIGKKNAEEVAQRIVPEVNRLLKEK